MKADGAASALARLLDRSVERIGVMAADGRSFDRAEVARIAGAWDEHAHGFFAVVGMRPRLLREPRARGVLRAMARPGGEDRAWMIRTGGPTIEPLLGRLRPAPHHYRDVRGLVRPAVLPVDGGALAADYELPEARVHWLSVERTGGGLRANLALRAPRRYADGSAQIHLTLDGLREVWFDSTDATGAEVRHGGDGVEVRLGAEGVLRAGGAVVLPVDAQWHLSQAGRAVDRLSVRKLRSVPDGERDGWPSGPLWDAASAFREAMRRIRRVRQAAQVGRVPLTGLCEALTGAGTRALAAAEDGPAAYGRLTERWSSAGPDNPEPAGDLPPDAELTLMMYEQESRLVTVNHFRPDDHRPRAATMTWPDRVLMSNTPDGLTVTTDDGPSRSR